MGKSETAMKWFTLRELVKSATAEQLGLANTPAVCEVAALERLVLYVLDPLREWFGAPITVTSGYRSVAVNKAVGGAKTSQHLRGEAADITGGSRSANKRLFEHVRDALPFDQLIWEKGGDEGPDWVHVSYRAGRLRGEVLRM